MKAAHIAIILALLSLPIATSVQSLNAECYGEETMMSRPGSLGICNWEQGDGKCDSDGDCCPGSNCSGNGFCVPC